MSGRAGLRAFWARADWLRHNSGAAYKSNIIANRGVRSRAIAKGAGPRMRSCLGGAGPGDTLRYIAAVEIGTGPGDAALRIGESRRVRPEGAVAATVLNRE